MVVYVLTRSVASNTGWHRVQSQPTRTPGNAYALLIPPRLTPSS